MLPKQFKATSIGKAAVPSDLKMRRKNKIATSSSGTRMSLTGIAATYATFINKKRAETTYKEILLALRTVRAGSLLLISPIRLNALAHPPNA